jgi:flagellar hook protein FlgE
MRLESAIRAGSESLFATGQAISVVGDNISNVNTTAYKTTRTEFADMFGAGPNTGDNPAVDGQIGDGAKVGRTRQLHDIGVLEGTGRQLDFAVDGKGYFMVQAPTTTPGATNPIYYTRAGNFSVTATGVLIGPDGKQVLGYGPNDTTRAGPLVPLNMKQITGGARATTRATLVGNISSTSPITGAPGEYSNFRDLARGTNATFMVNVIDSQGARREVQAVKMLRAAPQGCQWQWDRRRSPTMVMGHESREEKSQRVLTGQTALGKDS